VTSHLYGYTLDGRRRENAASSPQKKKTMALEPSPDFSIAIVGAGYARPPTNLQRSESVFGFIALGGSLLPSA
jgi:hypothetical protein